MNYKELETIAAKIRADVIKAIYSAGSGHPGGSLSAADIVTCLYFGEMNIDPKNPDKWDRDKLVLSKGHAGPVQYAALAERLLSARGHHVASQAGLGFSGTPMQRQG